MTFAGDRAKLRYKKLREMNQREQAGAIANRMCSIMFHVQELVKRTKVYKRRARQLRSQMIDKVAKGNQIEAFVFATWVLIEKKKVEEKLHLANRIVDFTLFFRSELIDEETQNNKLYDHFDRVAYLITSGFLSELEKELTILEQDYDIETREVKYAEKTKITKSTVREYMRRVMSNPKVISILTNEDSYRVRSLNSSKRLISPV